jgi:hypothetical protein
MTLVEAAGTTMLK